MSRKRLKDKQDTSRNLPSIISRKRKVDNIQGDDDRTKQQDDSTKRQRNANSELEDQVEIGLLQSTELFKDSSAACNQLNMGRTSSMGTCHATICWKRFNRSSDEDSECAQTELECRIWSSVDFWIDPENVLKMIILKDSAYRRNSDVFARHPTLQPRVRAIVLDWLIEVCEVYRLHRNTYYLALDFVDRYLACQTNILKQQLQLIGITALFIAAKLEEIYPPKLAEFAFVTDGACTAAEILLQELAMLKALHWDLNPVTVSNCFNAYMQLWNCNRENTGNFLIPQISGNLFMQAAQLLDLCTLDCGSLQFSYCVLVVSAISHMIAEQDALKISKYISELNVCDIQECLPWMIPFALTVRQHLGPKQKFFPHIDTDDAYNIQVHSVDLQMLEQAQARQASQLDVCSSPSTSSCIDTLLTPPNSREKPTL